MASRPHSSLLGDLRRLFGTGTAAGVEERLLLERFLTRRDEAAFAALVARHGPLVLGVCRRLLRDPHDVEDAFQATFLVLIRKARTIRDRDQLGPWLYGVAYRVAARARTVNIRRRIQERPGAEELSVQAATEPGDDRDELRTIIDAEVNRLPEKYRLPVVLCHLEGKTQAEAAQELQWTPDTVRGRLARARERLRDRLSRRDLTLPAGLASASVPPRLIDTTVAAAQSVLSGSAAVSAALTLATGVARTMTLTRLKSLVWFVPALAVGLAAIAGFREPLRAQPAPSPEPAKAPTALQERTLDVRVVAAKTGTPISDANVVLYHRGPTRGMTDAQGRCAVALPRDLPPAEGFSISLWKDGFCPVRVDLAGRDLNDPAFTTYTVELDPALPMGGVVVDDQGQPIMGAKVSLSLAERGPIRFRGKGREMFILDHFDPLTTDAMGRWECKLLPAKLTDHDRLEIRLAHPDFVSDVAEPSRPRASVQSLRDRTSRLVMTKGLVLTGSVSGPAGQPVAGATVSLAWNAHRPPSLTDRYTTTTDANGQFHFDHARPGEQALCVEAAGFAPELRLIDARAGANRFAVHLQAGRTIQGRVVDKKGEPIAGVSVRPDSWRGYAILDWSATTGADGRFGWESGPDDAVALLFWKDSYRRNRLEVEPGSGDLAVTLASPLRLHGTVTNAETGKPIEEFRLVPGLAGLPGRVSPQWQAEDARPGRAGRFEFGFGEYAPRLPRFLRVEAEGFLPAESRAYKDEEGDQAFDVWLRRAPQFAGLVRLPDSSPLAGALVLVATRSDFVRLEDGRLKEDGRPEDGVFQGTRLKTGPDGRFAFTTFAEPFTLVVLSDQGVATVDSSALAGSGDVTVPPWGRIGGMVRLGSKPGAGLAVVAISQRWPRYGGPGFMFINHGVAGEDGRFLIERVAPGDVQVGRSDRLYSHLVSAEVVAGRDALVTIGGTGRPVVGRVIPPADLAGVLDLSRARARLELVLPNPYPKEFETWDAERQKAWWESFRATAAGRAYFRAHNRYGVTVAADGTARAEDVPEGTYQLVLSLVQDLPGTGGNVGPRLTGQARRQVVVGAVRRGRSDDPLDIGALELTVSKVER